jgi:adenylate cyclase
MNYELISDISLELRSSLTSIYGALELLQSGAIDLASDQSKRLLEIAIRNTDRLVNFTINLENNPKTAQKLVKISKKIQNQLQSEHQKSINFNEVSERIDELKKHPSANKIALDKIKIWLLNSHLLQRLRINPYWITDNSLEDLEEIISEFLYGVKAGIFDLNWDVHCPHCNMITTEFKHLSNAKSVSSCPMCDRNFEIDFLERVEVTFSLSQSLEYVKIEPVCAPPPVLQSKFQLVTPRNHTESAIFEVEKGKYRYCCPLTCAKGIMIVEGEKTEVLQEVKIKQLPGAFFDKKEIVVFPGKVKLELTNVGHSLSGMIFHAEDLPNILTLEKIPPRLTGLQILHHPEYQQLFGDQVLSDRERMKIQSVTIMFTDITGSTRMYETLGDNKAYNIVRDHFNILFRAIEKQGGAVIKTVGDAVMASFMRNEQAAKAATDALSEFGNYNKNSPENEQIKVKVGIHRGQAVLVNLNNRMDYFGTTINKAARIQAVSKDNEISFSEEVYRDEIFLAALTKAGVLEVQKHTVDLKGIVGGQAVYTARVGSEAIISL